jgi:hypothetical protein
MPDVSRSERNNRGRFVAEEDGRQLGELTYTRTDDSLVSIDHTEVSPAAQGQGVGRQLVAASVAWARETGTKLMPRCSYARSVFEDDPTLSDVWQR